MSQKSTEKVMEMLTQDWAMSFKAHEGGLQVHEYHLDNEVVVDWTVGIINGKVTLVLALSDDKEPIWVDGRGHFALNFGYENRDLLVNLLAYSQLSYWGKDRDFLGKVLESTLVKLRELIDSQRPLEDS